MIVQACLNGARPASFHPRLPTTADALAADARAVVAAGAAEIHAHVRGDDGRETLAAAAVDRTVTLLRTAVPGTLLGISTGAWIEGDADRTLASIASWSQLPDYASVNLSETAAPAVIELLHRRGVGIEAGLASARDAERLLALGIGPLCLRILIEIEEQNVTAAHAAADAVLTALAKAPWSKAMLLHGFDATVWPLAEKALRLGLSTRVGLEDGAILPDGSTAPDNAALVAAAAELAAKVRPLP